MEKIIETTKSTRDKEMARNTANGHFTARENRAALAKQQMSEESAANDAKTARLRALRLAKEAEDREAALAESGPAAKPAAKKRTNRISV